MNALQNLQALASNKNTLQIPWRFSSGNFFYKKFAGHDVLPKGCMNYTTTKPRKETSTMSLYQSIYANVKKAHPDWENKRVYATVGSIMRNKNKKTA